MKTMAYVLLFLFVGCATTGGLLKLQLGMTKAQVIDILGEPDAARGSMRNKYDQVVEVWEYIKQKQNPTGGLPIVVPAIYWMYFYDGKLVQWGEAGDWRREADKIYEMRFR